MTKYFVRGTIAVKVNGDKTAVLIVPCTGFVTSDKPKRAIAFPVRVPKRKISNAKVIKLSDDGSFKCDAQSIKEHIPALLTVAASQKAIELRLADDSKTITGFVFPAPTDHANGR